MADEQNLSQKITGLLFVPHPKFVKIPLLIHALLFYSYTGLVYDSTDSTSQGLDYMCNLKVHQVKICHFIIFNIIELFCHI